MSAFAQFFCRAGFGLLSHLVLLTAANAHHTFTHQSAGEIRLFSIKELQFLVLKDAASKKSCEYLIPRRSGAQQYAVSLARRKHCPGEIWVNVSRDGKGHYQIGPVKNKPSPPFLPKNLKLEPVSGSDYSAVRTKLSVRDLTPAMTQEQVESALGKLRGFQRRTPDLKFKIEKKAKNSGFFGTIAEIGGETENERITVISHQTGADGHFSSPANSVVGVNRRYRVNSFSKSASTWEPVVAELEEKFGKPSFKKTEDWPDTDKVREVVMIWALNAKGEIVPDFKRYQRCGNSKLSFIRVSEGGIPENAIAKVGQLGFDLHHVDMFDPKGIPSPDECVMFLQNTLWVSLEGKVYRMDETVTDSGLLSDIFTKSVFDSAKKMAEKIKIKK